MCKKTAFFGSFKKKTENNFVQKNRILWQFLRKTGKILLATKKRKTILSQKNDVFLQLKKKRKTINGGKQFKSALRYESFFVF